MRHRDAVQGNNRRRGGSITPIWSHQRRVDRARQSGEATLEYKLESWHAWQGRAGSRYMRQIVYHCEYDVILLRTSPRAGDVRSKMTSWFREDFRRRPHLSHNRDIAPNHRNSSGMACSLRPTSSIHSHSKSYKRVFECVKINELEDDTTSSSSHIFVKIMMQEMMEGMGLKTLVERFKDPEVKRGCEGIFPMDVPKNTRFAINYFTSIGLGVITEEMREYLKVSFIATCSLFWSFWDTDYR
jgi:hypothetical protein